MELAIEAEEEPEGGSRAAFWRDNARGKTGRSGFEYGSRLS